MKYLPARSLWINKLFIVLANVNQKTCLTIDCSGINENGPRRFRTEANSPEKQVCCFNMLNNDQVFNVFTANRINQQETKKGVYFQTDRVKSKTNADLFEANTLLRQNSTSNDNPQNFGSGSRFTKNRERYDSDVKRRKTNRRSVKPRFPSGR